MSTLEYAEWLAGSIPDYAAEKVRSGEWASASSLERSKQEHEELLPRGLETPGQHFYAILDAGSRAVGMIWFAERTRFELPIAYVYKVEVTPQHQRQGHARGAFEALEAVARDKGLHGVALHVFGNNAPARSLYERLGYEPTNIHMFKALTGSGTQPATNDRAGH
jgi:ribosomal protein S18 acetylase RimI-like enzyme